MCKFQTNKPELVLPKIRNPQVYPELSSIDVSLSSFPGYFVVFVVIQEQIRVTGC